MAHFENKTLLITGGTGSFGNAVLNRFLSTDIGEIRILSRDEKSRMICATSIKRRCLRFPGRSSFT
jgi:FlaA1/EpsC-like NDP-sugar epimerase